MSHSHNDHDYTHEHGKDAGRSSAHDRLWTHTRNAGRRGDWCRVDRQSGVAGGCSAHGDGRGGAVHGSHGVTADRSSGDVDPHLGVFGVRKYSLRPLSP